MNKHDRCGVKQLALLWRRTISNASGIFWLKSNEVWPFPVTWNIEQWLLYAWNKCKALLLRMEWGLVKRCFFLYIHSKKLRNKLTAQIHCMMVFINAKTRIGTNHDLIYLFILVSTWTIFNTLTHKTSIFFFSFQYVHLSRISLALYLLSLCGKTLVHFLQTIGVCFGHLLLFQSFTCHGSHTLTWNPSL